MIFEDERGMNLEFFYDNVVAVSNQLETLTALEFFLRPTKRLKMQTPTFNFRRISLSTIGKGLDSNKLIFYSFVFVFGTSFVLNYLYLYSVI